MKYNDAIKLHNEDEVIVKETNTVMDVVEIEIHPSTKQVDVMLTDGNWYNHKDIR